jgi:hypothetical protein
MGGLGIDTSEPPGFSFGCFLLDVFFWTFSFGCFLLDVFFWMFSFWQWVGTISTTDRTLQTSCPWPDDMNYL